MTALVQARELTKSYGRHRGIVAVSFDLAEGEVFGFLGPNGAGKTTTCAPSWACCAHLG